ncbi:MAG: DUF4389 domain-containing protein [Gammaproteobacteria bacterium]|jgi:hypothetical protein|nr:DUF4389 domain-containing protein [Gammaproteobacteria bacterium]
MDDDTRKNLSNRNIWSRGLYMLFFVIAYSVAETVMALVSLFQFFHALFRGKANPTAQHLGANLGVYILQIVRYQTFNSENQPFPFSDWPDEAIGETPWSDTQPFREKSGNAANYGEADEGSTLPKRPPTQPQ